MNAQEKLRDIEQDFNESLKTGKFMVVPGDIKWLIRRVKKLTAALESLDSGALMEGTSLIKEVRQMEIFVNNTVRKSLRDDE